MVGITLWSSTGPTACLLADALKKREPGLLLLGGGPDCLGYSAAGYLEHFDYLIQNEGERSVCRFVQEVERKGRVPSTKGVWFMKDGQASLTAPAERIEELDELPFPDFSDFAVKDYREGLPIQFSRGCNANCVFCTNKKYFVRQVSRSASSLCREVETHIRNTTFPRSRRSLLLRRPRRFIFADDSLLSSSNLPEFMDFCDLVIRKRIRISWSIYAQRILPSLRDNHVKRMKKAGLQRLTFGVESFSASVRRDMGKVASDRVTDRVLDMFLEQGIQVNLLMIYGYPTESDEDFEATWSRIERQGNRFGDITFNCFVPTDEYLSRRPGVVTVAPGPGSAYRWYSSTVDLTSRRWRFLRLAELLERLRVNFKIGDPHMIRYYKRWNKRQERRAMKDWKRLELHP